jgi:hypothetical protein
MVEIVGGTADINRSYRSNELKPSSIELLKRFSKEEYFKRNEESLKAIEDGRLISNERAFEYFKNKKKRNNGKNANC